MTRVGIVMPVWNAGLYLDETLGMLTRQTHRDFRLVAVDDGSSDDSAMVLQSWKRRAVFNMHVVTQENRGVAAARNRGLAEISEPLVALLDADDAWHPTKLALQVKQLHQVGEIQAVGCGYETWDALARTRSRSVHFRWGREAVRLWATFRGPGPLMPSTLMLRTSVFESVGPFDVELSTAADLEFAARLISNHRVTSLDQVLTRYRLHESQMHLSPQALRRDYLSLTCNATFRDSLDLTRKEMLASYAAYLSAKAARAGRITESVRHAHHAWSMAPRVTAGVLAASVRRATLRR